MGTRRQQPDEFDVFRRERQQARVRSGPEGGCGEHANAALRELEQVEARQIREQQLSREMHDFFSAATQQAATIVEKVAKDEEVASERRLHDEMQSFLVDAVERMNTFIATIDGQQVRADCAHTEVAPDVKRLVGPVLDGFRYAGTPATRDDHIGRDPFGVTVAAARDELQASMQRPDAALLQSSSLAVTPEDPAPRPSTATPEGISTPSCDPGQREPSLAELSALRVSLQEMVRQGAMTSEAAAAAWRARAASPGAQTP